MLASATAAIPQAVAAPAGDPVSGMHLYQACMGCHSLDENEVGPNAGQRSTTMRHDSYSMVRWDAGGLEYWAVSDIDTADLDQFRDAFRKASGT